MDFRDLIGKRLGPCVVKDLMAVGGFAAIYRATDETLKTDRALKIFHPHLTHDAEFRDRCIAEMRTLATLDHPNIVVLAFPVDEGGNFGFAMELVEGQTLKAMLGKGALKPAQAIDIMRQVLSAAAYAHERGVVHRDLSTDNVMVRTDGVAKVMDFGIARTLIDHELTRTGTSIGKPAYMSPEQFDGVISRACDVYAAGVIAYELLSGTPPYDGETAIQYFQKHALAPIPELLPFDHPRRDAIQQIINKALAKQAADRYADAGQMLEAWRALDGTRPATRRIAGDEATELAVRKGRVHALLQTARDHFYDDRYAQALTAIDELLSVDPEHEDALLLRGETRAAMERAAVVSDTDDDDEESTGDALAPSAEAPPAQAPFVGRDHEFGRLNDAVIRLAREGRGGLRFVFGPHGSGKTRLLDELLAKHAPKGLRILRADGPNTKSQAGPFAPCVQQLFSREDWVDDRLRRLRLNYGPLATTVAPELLNLPVFRKVDPVRGLPPEVVANDVASLLCDVAEGVPVIVAIDGGEQFDDTATDLLLKVVRKTLANRVLVIIAAAVNPAVQRDAIVRLQDALAASDQVDAILLGPMEKTGLRKLIDGAVAPLTASTALYRAVSELAKGMPGVALAALETLREKADGWHTDGEGRATAPQELLDRLPLPPTLEEDLARQYRSRSAKERKLLDLLATAPLPAPTALIEKATALPLREVKLLIEELAADNYIRRSAQPAAKGAERWLIASATLGAAIRMLLGANLRAQFAALGKAALAVGAELAWPHDAMAHVWREAGDPKREFASLRDHADALQREGDMLRSLSVLRRCMAVGKAIPGWGEAPAILARVARAEAATGALVRARQTIEQALGILPKGKELALARELYFARADIHIRLRETGDAVRLATQARDAVPEVEEGREEIRKAKVRFDVAVARAELSGAMVPEAMKRLRPYADKLARESDPWLAARMRLALGEAALVSGDFPEADLQFSAITTTPGYETDLPLRLAIAVNLSRAAIDAGRRADGDKILEQGLTMANAVGDRWSQVRLWSDKSLWAFRAMRWGAAIRFSEGAAALAYRCGFSLEHGLAKILRGLAGFAEGKKTRDAKAFLMEGLDEAGAGSGSVFEAHARYDLALLSHAQGNPSTAKGHLRLAGDRYKAWSVPRFTPRIVITNAWIDADAAGGRVNAALKQKLSALTDAPESDPWARGLLAITRGVLADADDKYDDAAKHYARAKETFEKAGVAALALDATVRWCAARLRGKTDAGEREQRLADLRRLRKQLALARFPLMEERARAAVNG